MKDHNPYLATLLDNVYKERSYYVGGTLCIDLRKENPLKEHFNDGEKEAVMLMVNLDESFSIVYSDSSNKIRLMSINNCKKAFSIYKGHKSDNDYYKEKLSKSCVRHF